MTRVRIAWTEAGDWRFQFVGYSTTCAGATHICVTITDDGCSHIGSAYGASVVVKDITDKRGCSLGPLTSYLLIDVSGFDVTQVIPRASTLAHEMGHQNGLWHRPSVSNLMYKDRERGTDLSKWQRAWIRNSRFVTFL